MSFTNLIAQNYGANQQMVKLGGGAQQAYDQMRSLVTSLTLQVGELEAQLSLSRDRLREAEDKIEREDAARADGTLVSNGALDTIHLQAEVEESKREMVHLRELLAALEEEKAQAAQASSDSHIR